jgi:hypothetical protein
MADNDYSSIWKFNSAAQSEAWPFIGYIILDGIVTLVVLWIVGTIANTF